MAQLFLSYARQDRECAELFARALSSHGWTVWWDRRIQVGRSFSEVIEYQLEQASCVIVLWSRHSVISEWVQSEAAEAARRKVLVPVRIEDVRPPLEFRRLHTADLCDWRNGFSGPELEACVASIEPLLQQTVAKQPQPPSETPPAAPPAGLLISQDGQQFHAPDMEMLRHWVEEGRIKPDSQIFAAAFRRWVSASEVPDLQDLYQRKKTVETQLPAKETPPAAPPAGLLISQDGQQFYAPDTETLRRWAEEGRVKEDSCAFDPERQCWVFVRTLPFLEGMWPKTPPPVERAKHTKNRRVYIATGFGLLVVAVIVISIVASSSKPDSTTDTAATDTSITEAVIADTSLTTSTDTIATDTFATDTIAADTIATDTSATLPVTDTTGTTLVSQQISIFVENGCTDKTIAVAVCYLHPSNRWAVSGWYPVDPQKTELAIKEALGPEVYFYAKGGESRWYGTSDPLTRTAPIHSTKGFGAWADELTGEGVETVTFFGRTVDAGRTSYTQRFACTN